jgi:integrase
MPTLQRNHRQIAAAKGTPGERTEFRIEGVKGLVLRISEQGARSWYVRYSVDRSDGTRQFRRHRIGDAEAISLSDATDAARKVIAAVDIEGRDPQGEVHAKKLAADTVLTFGRLFEAWYTRHAEPQLARPADEHKKYRNHLEPTFGTRPVAEIKRTDVATLRDQLINSSGPVSSNNIVTLFNRVMNWAVDEGLIEFNPAHRLRKTGEERPRERVLSEAEILAFWRALDRMERSDGANIAKGEKGRMLSPVTRSALRLILLTGQRRAEVVAISRSELQLSGDNPVWTLPGKRTKNRLLHRIPLAPMALAEVQRALLAAGPRSYLFPTPDPDKDVSILPYALTTAMARLCADIGIERAGPHDLRRTVGTELARLGVPTHVRALVLNHSPESRGVTDAVYNRYAYDKEKREALVTWENRLRQLLR